MTAVPSALLDRPTKDRFGDYTGVSLGVDYDLKPCSDQRMAPCVWITAPNGARVRVMSRPDGKLDLWVLNPDGDEVCKVNA